MTAQLAIALADREIDVRVVSLYNSPKTGNVEALEERGIVIEYYGKQQGFDPKIYLKFRASLQRWQPDIVHTHLYVLRYCLPYIRSKRRRWIHTVHNLARHEVDSLGKVFNRAAFKLGVTPVAIAGEVQRSMQEVYGIKELPIIPNGIDLRPFALLSDVDRLNWRRQEGFREDNLLFVAVGRLTAQKNHDLLLQAFVSIANDFPHAELLIVGEGELRSYLTARAVALGVSSKVRFLGLRSDVTSILAASDVFVMTSDWEGNPISVMEALAAGKPVVATQVGGVPELIQQDRTGLLVPPCDVATLAAAMQRLGSEFELRRAMGDAAKRHASQFGIAEMAERYLSLYKQKADTRTQ